MNTMINRNIESNERKIQQMKNTTNQLIENGKFQAVFARLINFNLTITEDQADKLLGKINQYVINFEWSTLSGDYHQELTVNSNTKPFLKFILTEGLTIRNYGDWGSDDIDRIQTRYVNRITLKPTESTKIMSQEKPVVKSVKPIEVKKSTPTPTSKSGEWIRNPNTSRLIKGGGPTYKKLYPESKPTPLQSTVKPVEKPIPAPRTVKTIEKPIPAPRKNTKQMVQEYEDNIILPIERPIPAPRTKQPVVKLNKIDKSMINVHESEQKIKKIDDIIQNKYNTFTTQKTDVINYVKKDVSLNRFRIHEAGLSKTMKMKDSSFRKLFEKRLLNIKGVRERISITLNVDILNGLIVTKKSYGPFEMDIPQLSIEDMYRFMVYTLLKNNFTLLSAEEIKKIGCKIITHNKRFFEQHTMAGLKLETYLLSKQRPIKSYGKNTCVVDYVWDQVQGKKGFKSYTHDKLKNEIYKFVYEAPMVCTEELVEWAKQCHTNVSIHTYDSTYKKFLTFTNSNTRTDITLVYIVKDHHCIPITDEKLKLVAMKANQGGYDNLLKHMSDLKWTRRHENIHRVEKLNDLYDLEKENNIIILPEEVKMTQAINTYILKSNLYVEYFHWNNNGVLDGFIDHKQNMYLLNEEYDVRKSICDKLFDIYKTYDFKWSNQSFTSISTNLYRQMSGYLPESSYNVNTRQMLDDFYPRALQWCTTEDIPDDVVNIDISKSYPSILLNNTSPVPIYTIHDVIEPFNCKSDLRLCGEFYINETILKNYGSPLKIEAGFYSSNLISYLVENLNMPLKQIKYKIITKRALKPDTFKSYIKYIFDKFPENEAKKLANSFIGDLGRKYNKTNKVLRAQNMILQCVVGREHWLRRELLQSITMKIYF